MSSSLVAFRLVDLVFKQVKSFISENLAEKPKNGPEEGKLQRPSFIVEASNQQTISSWRDGRV